jgi:hypothetical protein
VVSALRRRRCAMQPRVAAQRLPWVHVALKQESHRGLTRVPPIPRGQVAPSDSGTSPSGLWRNLFEVLTLVDSFPGSPLTRQPRALWWNAFGVLEESAQVNKNRTVRQPYQEPDAGACLSAAISRAANGLGELARLFGAAGRAVEAHLRLPPEIGDDNRLWLPSPRWLPFPG